MKTIIRIEHETGNGIYNARKNGNIIFGSHSKAKDIEERHSTNEYPTLFGDRVLYKKMIKAIGGNYEYKLAHQYFFAFNNLNQFEKAFKRSEMQELFDLGFNVKLIEVSSCLNSKFQVIFLKKDIVNEKIINDLFI